MADQKTDAAKGRDNNRRLAALESSVSALAIALTANGVDVPDGADPVELAIAQIKIAADAGAQTKALEDQVEELRFKIGELEGSGNATPGEIAAIDRADKAEARVKELTDALAEAAGMDGADASAALEDQIDELQRQITIKDARIAELEAGAPAAPRIEPDEPETVEAAPSRERPESARDVGPGYPGLHPSSDIIALRANGDVSGFELAFSNGEYEIVALQPVPIGATDLVISEGRLLLSPPVHAKLLATDATEILHGFGLLLGGEQIAYCPLLDPLRLDPGTERRFDRTIYF